jgi:hypothetical protein
MLQEKACSGVETPKQAAPYSLDTYSSTIELERSNLEVAKAW